MVRIDKKTCWENSQKLRYHFCAILDSLILVLSAFHIQAKLRNLREAVGSQQHYFGTSCSKGALTFGQISTKHDQLVLVELLSYSIGLVLRCRLKALFWMVQIWIWSSAYRRCRIGCGQRHHYLHSTSLTDYDAMDSTHLVGNILAL
jgi:hypothetical protein